MAVREVRRAVSSFLQVMRSCTHVCWAHTIISSALPDDPTGEEPTVRHARITSPFVVYKTNLIKKKHVVVHMCPLEEGANYTTLNGSKLAGMEWYGHLNRRCALLHQYLVHRTLKRVATTRLCDWFSAP